MTGNRVAKRYAKALYSLADDRNLLREINADLSFIANTIDKNENIQAILENPVITESKKLTVCIEMFSSQISELSVQFLKFLNEKNRLAILRESCIEFDGIFKEKSGIVEAMVFSAVPLKQEQHDKIEDVLSHKTGKKVILHGASDPLLMGGFTVRIGDDVFDSTLKSKLKKLSKSLKNE